MFPVVLYVHVEKCIENIMYQSNFVDDSLYKIVYLVKNITGSFGLKIVINVQIIYQWSCILG